MIGTWIDYSGGTVSGKTMANHGITGALRYVGIGSTGKRLTHAEYADHCAHGRLTIAVVERSTTDADGRAPAGTANAESALTDLKVETAGLPPIPWVFMANDQPTSTPAEVDYVRAAAAVFGPAFAVGGYGFGAFLLALARAGVGTPGFGWQAGPAPSRTGSSAVATFWQRQGGSVAPADGPTTPTTIVLDGVTCDLNNQLMELPMTDPFQAKAVDAGPGSYSHYLMNVGAQFAPGGVNQVPVITAGLGALKAQVAALSGALSADDAEILGVVSGVDRDVKAGLTQLAATLSGLPAGAAPTDAQVAALGTAVAGLVISQLGPQIGPDVLASVAAQFDKK